MKALLISANTERINLVPLPLGLACVAAAARNAGHDVRVLDLMAEGDTETLVREAIASFGPGVIGISIRNIDDQVKDGRFLLDGVRNIVRICRSLSDAPIVLGGAGYSIFPEQVLDYLKADMGIRGEGEVAFPILLDRLAQKADLSATPGLYRRGRGPQGARVFVKALDSLPLFAAQEFLAPPGPDVLLPFQTRRGCPLDCSYCSTAAIEGRTVRRRSPEAAAAELARFTAAGYGRIYFVDNTFNLPPGYAIELCRRIIALGLDFSWQCIIYPGHIDAELVELMAGAGCREVSVGFESGCARILRAMNKRFGAEEIRRTVELFKRCGIRQLGFLLLGGPGETRESALESLAFAASLPLDQLKVSVGVRIYPDTALARQALAEGVITPDDNLLLPTFYLAAGLEQWLPETVRVWMADRPHWIT